VIAAREKLCFQLGQIGNMDEVALTFDVPSNRTLKVLNGSQLKLLAMTKHITLPY
jgi:hypothetical protein